MNWKPNNGGSSQIVEQIEVQLIDSFPSALRHYICVPVYAHARAHKCLGMHLCTKALQVKCEGQLSCLDHFHLTALR